MVVMNPDSKYDKVDLEKKMIVKKDNLKQVQTEQAVTDPGEHFVKGDGLEDAPEDTIKTFEKEKVEQDGAPTHWEDVEEEGS
jgi:hypothetical protein